MSGIVFNKNKRVIGDTTVFDATRVNDASTLPPPMSALSPHQISNTNGKALFVEVGADLTADLPPLGNVTNGGGLQTDFNGGTNQQITAPTFSVDLGHLNAWACGYNADKYAITWKIALDSAFIKRDPALAPDADVYQTNPSNSKRNNEPEPVYFCSDQLQATSPGSRYFLRFGQEALTNNLQSVAFARFENKLPSKHSFQFPCWLDPLPDNNIRYYANSPRQPGLRDMSTGRPFASPFYQNQFVKQFNIRFLVTADIMLNYLPVYGHVNPAVPSVSEGGAAAETAGGAGHPTAPPPSAEGLPRGGGGGVGGDLRSATPADISRRIGRLIDGFASVAPAEHADKFDTIRKGLQFASGAASTIESIAQIITAMHMYTNGGPLPAETGEAGEAGFTGEGRQTLTGDPEIDLPDVPEEIVRRHRVARHVHFPPVDPVTGTYNYDAIAADYENTFNVPSDQVGSRIAAIRQAFGNTGPQALPVDFVDTVISHYNEAYPDAPIDDRIHMIGALHDIATTGNLPDDIFHADSYPDVPVQLSADFLAAFSALESSTNDEIQRRVPAHLRDVSIHNLAVHDKVMEAFGFSAGERRALLSSGGLPVDDLATASTAPTLPLERTMPNIPDDEPVATPVEPISPEIPIGKIVITPGRKRARDESEAVEDVILPPAQRTRRNAVTGKFEPGTKAAPGGGGRRTTKKGKNVVGLATASSAGSVEGDTVPATVPTFLFKSQK